MARASATCFACGGALAEGAPDLVLYPDSEHDVLMTLRAAARHDVVVIPFGGGSNIAGCLERSESRRMAVSLDMRRMRRVLEVDTESFTARIEAGAFGPDLEEQLNSYGLTLGHFPDSFLHSTLGGWIATRSAGMQSDKYGKIEDMVIALRMVTPVGVLATRTVPKSSNGIDVNHLCIGSEGTLGVITEATMRVHPRPESRRTHGYLFPEFEAGIEAMHECVTKRVRAFDVAAERSRQDGAVAGLQTAIVAALAGSDQNHEGLPQSEGFRFASLPYAHHFRGQQSRCRPPA